jgi:hypothetical protein
MFNTGLGTEHLPFPARTSSLQSTSIEFTAHDSNMLTQPADYLAYAIAQVYADPHSLRSNLCAPIMQYDFLKAIPAIPSREQVREALSWTVE